MKRLDIMGRVTECSVKDESKIGIGRCIHCPGDKFILKKGQSPQDLLDENREFVNGLERKQAKENKKITEEVPSEIYDAVSSSDQNISLIVAGTGVGKSAVIHSLMFDSMRDENNELVSKGIIVVPNNELADQFRKYGMHEDNGYHVLTYQKLMEWSKTKEKSEDYDLGFDISQCKVVSFDECHRSVASEWRKGCDLLISSLQEDSKIYGFTATPERTDGSNASEIFGDSVYEISTEEALERECYSNPPDYVTSTSDYSALKRVSKLRKMLDKSSKVPDSVRRSIAQMLDVLDVPEEIVQKEQGEIISSELDKIMESGNGAKIVVFCQDIKDVKETKARYDTLLCEKYGKKNVSSLEYTSRSGEFSEKDKKFWSRFQDGDKSPEVGKVEIVYSIKKFDEGFHIDNLDMAIRCKPTESGIISKQEDGRMLGRRKKPGVILDFAGSLRRKDSLDWHRMADHVRNSDYYGRREILHDRSSEYYKMLKKAESEIFLYCGTYVEYNGEYYGPADILKMMDLPETSKSYAKLRRTYVDQCIKHGMSAEQIFERKGEIQYYCGGEIRGIDF